MDNQDSMQNQMMMKDSMNGMMMKEMQKHHTLMYTFDVLVLVGLATIIVFLAKIPVLICESTPQIRTYMEEQHQGHKLFPIKPIYGLYLLLILGGIYLVVYHGPHLYTLLPLIFFLFCPLMHLFHGHHHRSSGKDNKTSDDRNNKPRCH